MAVQGQLRYGQVSATATLSSGMDEACHGVIVYHKGGLDSAYAPHHDAGPEDHERRPVYRDVPVTLDLGQDRMARLRLKVRGPRSEIELPLMPAKPKSLRFNDLNGVLAEVKSVDQQD